MVCAPAGGFFAGVLELQIELEIFGLRKFLIPLAERLDVHGADVRVPFAQQIGDQMAADETARAGDQNFVFHGRPKAA